MITTLLLVLIYFAFISLGLPDGLLGVSWPVMHMEFNVPIDAAGLITFLTVMNTIISSLLSGKIVSKLGTGKVTLFSCILTGSALLGFSLAPSYWWLLILAFPLGFGAGSVDAALNSYVALHFKAHHMNWLHSFWGVGATLGPIIMGQRLAAGLSWRSGYSTLSIIQLSLAVILLFALPLWKRHHALVNHGSIGGESPDITAHKTKLHIRTLFPTLITFLFYCTVEGAVGLWGSSYLVYIRDMHIEHAANWVAAYYGGITLGRMISGFISIQVSNDNMIRGGLVLALLAVASLLLPLPPSLLGIPMVLIGMGFAPVFPSLMHSTPEHFGKENASSVVGYQMASAYVGAALVSPILGVIMKNTSFALFPWLILICLTVVVMGSEKVRTMHSESSSS